MNKEPDMAQRKVEASQPPRKEKPFKPSPESQELARLIEKEGTRRFAFLTHWSDSLLEAPLNEAEKIFLGLMQRNIEDGRNRDREAAISLLDSGYKTGDIAELIQRFSPDALNYQGLDQTYSSRIVEAAQEQRQKQQKALLEAEIEQRRKRIEEWPRSKDGTLDRLEETYIHNMQNARIRDDSQTAATLIETGHSPEAVAHAIAKLSPKALNSEGIIEGYGAQIAKMAQIEIHQKRQAEKVSRPLESKEKEPSQPSREKPEQRKDPQKRGGPSL